MKIDLPSVTLAELDLDKVSLYNLIDYTTTANGQLIVDKAFIDRTKIKMLTTLINNNKPKSKIGLVNTNLPKYIITKACVNVKKKHILTYYTNIGLVKQYFKASSWFSDFFGLWVRAIVNTSDKKLALGRGLTGSSWGPSYPGEYNPMYYYQNNNNPISLVQLKNNLIGNRVFTNTKELVDQKLTTIVAYNLASTPYLNIQQKQFQENLKNPIYTAIDSIVQYYITTDELYLNLLNGEIIIKQAILTLANFRVQEGLGIYNVYIVLPVNVEGNAGPCTLNLDVYYHIEDL